MVKETARSRSGNRIQKYLFISLPVEPLKKGADLFPLKPSRGLLIIVALAAIGYALVTLPPMAVGQYRAAAEINSWVGYAYLALVSVGGLLLLGLIVWALWRVGGAHTISG